MPLKHKTFCRKTFLAKQLRDSRESLYLNFVFCLNPFLREELSRELLAKMPLKKFLMKNMRNVILKKTIKTRKHKNTLKNI